MVGTTPTALLPSSALLDAFRQRTEQQAVSIQSCPAKAPQNRDTQEYDLFLRTFIAVQQ